MERKIQLQCEVNPDGFNKTSRRKFLKVAATLTGELFMEACLPPKVKEPTVPPETSFRLQKESAKTPRTYSPTVTPQIELLPTVEGKIRDYFPTAIGSHWIYEINTREVQPLDANRIITEGTPAIVERRHFPPAIKDPARRTFGLSFSIKETAYFDFLGDNGWRMQVDKDELGIFDGRNVNWILSGPHFHIAQLIVYPKSHDLAQGGFSEKYIFFDERPGTGIRLAERPGIDENVGLETLTFKGSENGYLLFERVVDAIESNENTPLCKGFSEKMWYQKGVGLTRLEQEIDNEISMVWNLTQFIKGEE